MNRPDAKPETNAGDVSASQSRPRSAELHNDRTHDSSVDTDGKNREAARLAGEGYIAPDEVTTSNATLVNSVPEAEDGLAGFDSRKDVHRLPFALQSGYEAIDKGMSEPELSYYDADAESADPHAPNLRRTPGRIHIALNHLRPTRLIELHRKA